MTLQTTGAISLGNIQTEFGGVNPIPISEYVKGGSRVPNTPTNINIKSTLSNMKFSDYYGGSVVSILDTQTLYVGYADYSYTQEGVTIGRYVYGYRQEAVVPTGGSVTDGTSNLYAGTPSILAIAVDFVEVESYLIFRVNGTQTNSGWTSMTFNGTTYNRVDATYTAGGFTTWSWYLGATLGPLHGYVGQNVTVTWN